MKRHSCIPNAALYGITLLLLMASGTVAAITIGDTGAPKRESAGTGTRRHSETHKRWKKETGSLKNRIKKLEKKYWHLIDINRLKEGSVAKRKADNFFKTIHDLQEKEKSIPGDLYRTVVDLKTLLGDVSSGTL